MKDDPKSIFFNMEDTGKDTDLVNRDGRDGRDTGH
jgi:hypothetical protein